MLPTEGATGPGRPAIDNRRALVGILFVLRTGAAWQRIPAELGCGSGTTLLRRFTEWRRSGVWERIEPIILRHIGAAELIPHYSPVRRIMARRALTCIAS